MATTAKKNATRRRPTQKQLDALAKGRAKRKRTTAKAKTTTATKRRRSLCGVDDAKANIRTALKEVQRLKHSLEDIANGNEEQALSRTRIAAQRTESIEDALQTALATF